MEVIRIIDPTIYPRKALLDAQQAFRDYCSVQIFTLDDGGFQVNVSVNELYRHDARRTVLEFLNYALDRAMQIHFDDS